MEAYGGVRPQAERRSSRSHGPSPDRDDAGAMEADPSVSEFVTMVRFVRHVVRKMLELSLDIVLVFLVILPLLIPWRTLAVIKTLSPESTSSWREELRLRALVHVVCALLDVVLSPVMFLAFFMPTRIVAVVELLYYQAEMRADVKVGGRLVNVHYNLAVRLALAAQAVNGLMDLPCLVLAFLTVLFPWRAVILCSGQMRLLARLGPAQESYKPENFACDQGRWQGVFEDLRKWWLRQFACCIADLLSIIAALLSCAIPSRIWPFARELRQLLRERGDYTFASRSFTIQIIKTDAIFVLCLQNLYYGMLDLFVFPFLLLVIVTLVRAIPLLEDLRRDWSNLPHLLVVSVRRGIYGGCSRMAAPRFQSVESDSTAFSVGSVLAAQGVQIGVDSHSTATEAESVATREIGRCNSAADSLVTRGSGRSSSVPESVVTLETRWSRPDSATTASDATSCRRRPSQIPRLGNELPGTGEFHLAEEFNGRYILSRQSGKAMYTRMASNVGSSTYEFPSRLAFLELYQSRWQLCLNQDSSTAVLRWYFEDKYHSMCPQTERVVTGVPCQRQLHAEVLGGGHAGSWHPCSKEFPVVEVLARGPLHLWEFGISGYNIKLRMHVLRHVMYLCADLLVAPFFLLPVIFGYRFPALLARMREDAELRLAEQLGLDAEGVTTMNEFRKSRRAKEDGAGIASTVLSQGGYSFGMRSRAEVFKQCIFILADVLLLPLLLIVAATVYRVRPLIQRFTAFDSSWHLAIVMNANLILFDFLLLMPFLLVYCTVYRFQYVREVYCSCQGDAVPSNDSSRPADNIVSDHFNVEWAPRLEVLRQAGLVCCDALVAPFLLLVFVTRYRQRYLEGTFQARTLHWHGAVLGSVAWILHDCLLLGPMALVFVIFAHRARTIVRLVQSPPLERDGGDPQNCVRLAIYIQIILVLCDILVFPCAVLCYITFYRWKHIKPYLRDITHSDALYRNTGNLVKFHTKVCYNALILMHDLVLMLPASFLLVITIYRIDIVRAGYEAGVANVSQNFEADSMAVEGEIDGSQAEEPAREFPTEPGDEDLVMNDMHVDDFDSQQQEQPWQPNGGPAPEQWHRIASRLTQEDPRWAELVNWNAVPARDPEQFSRKRFWHEVLGLFLDLPFVLSGFFICVTVWRLPVLISKLRKPQRDWARRKAVVWQCVLTVRDLLILPVAVLFLFTPRGFGFVAHLCARRHEPLKLKPLLEVLSLEVSAPSNGDTHFNVKIRSSLLDREELFGLSRPSLAQVLPGTLRVQVLGSGFWHSVEQALGRAKSSLVKVLMPLRPSRGQFMHVPPTDAAATDAPASPKSPQRKEVEIVMAFSAPSGPLRGAMDRMFAKVDQNERMKIQVECMEEIPVFKDVSFHRPAVACSFVLPVSAMSAMTQPGASSRFSRDSLGSREDLRQMSDVPHQGVVESFAGIVAYELCELMVDLFHLLLFLGVLLVPWRFFSLVRSLCEPDELWPARNAEYMLECVRDADVALRKIRGDLLPACNSMAKSADLVTKWCTRGEVPMNLASSPGSSLRECTSLIWLVKQASSRVPLAVSNAVSSWLRLEDAHFYYAALRAYANSVLSSDRITVEEHGVIIGRARSAESSFTKACQRARREIDEIVQSCVDEANRAKSVKCGWFQKDTNTKRHIVRSVALAAAMDVLGIIACIVVVATLYRLPGLIAELYRESAMAPTSVKFKTIVSKHLQAGLYEMWLLLNILILSVLVVLTIVRLPEAANEAVAVFHSLESLRDMLRKHLADAIQSFWELFSLLTFVKTYKLLGSVVAHFCLVPPVCLGEQFSRLFGPPFQQLHVGVRLTLSVVAFYGLALFPVLLCYAAPAVDVCVVLVVFMFCVLALMLCNAISISRGAACERLRSFAAQEPLLAVRSSWANIISVSSLFSSRAMLISYLLCIHVHEDVGLPTACEIGDGLSVFAIAATVALMLLIATLFLSEQSSADELRKGPLMMSAQVLLAKFSFTPVIIGLVTPLVPICGDEGGAQVLSSVEALFVFVLSCYIATTQSLSCAGYTLRAWSGGGTEDSSVDVRFPPLFSMGSDFLDLLIVGAVVLCGNDTLHLVLTLFVGCLRLAWVPLYPRLFSSPTCLVPHLVPVQVGGEVAVVWALVFISMTRFARISIAIFISGAFLILCASMAASRRIYSDAFKERQQRLYDSGIPDHVDAILSAKDNVCVSESLWAGQTGRERWRMVFSSAPSMRYIKVKLLDFERHILAERLDAGFISGRDEWITQVDRASTYYDLEPLVRRLSAALRMPSTIPILTLFSGKILGRRDLASGVVDFLVGHQSLDIMLGAALLTTSSSSGCVDIAVHCKHARVALEDVLLHFRRDARNHDDGVALAEAVAAQGDGEGAVPRVANAHPDAGGQVSEGPGGPPPPERRPQDRQWLTWSYLQTLGTHVFDACGEEVDSEPSEMFVAGRRVNGGVPVESQAEVAASPAYALSLRGDGPGPTNPSRGGGAPQAALRRPISAESLNIPVESLPVRARHINATRYGPRLQERSEQTPIRASMMRSSSMASAQSSDEPVPWEALELSGSEELARLRPTRPVSEDRGVQLVRATP